MQRVSKLKTMHNIYVHKLKILNAETYHTQIHMYIHTYIHTYINTYINFKSCHHSWRRRWSIDNKSCMHMYIHKTFVYIENIRIEINLTFETVGEDLNYSSENAALVRLDRKLFNSTHVSIEIHIHTYIHTLLKNCNKIVYVHYTRNGTKQSM